MKKIISATIAMATAATVLLAGEDLSPKGIFRDTTSTPTTNGVKYFVTLARGADRREVPVSFGFRNGDRFKLQVNLKDDAYVYVLNRTLDGDPDSLSGKGIDIVRDEDRRRPSSQVTYNLLFPGPKERPVKIRAGRYREIPGDVALVMDEHPGVEKVYVVVSDHELDLPSYFSEGRLRQSSGRESRRTDSSDDVLSRLNKELSDWAVNAKTENPTSGGAEAKGIIREPESYTVGSRSKPILVEISLKHYRD